MNLTLHTGFLGCRGLLRGELKDKHDVSWSCLVQMVPYCRAQRMEEFHVGGEDGAQFWAELWAAEGSPRHGGSHETVQKLTG